MEGSEKTTYVQIIWREGIVTASEAWPIDRTDRRVDKWIDYMKALRA